jgi:hypothetical protein
MNVRNGQLPAREIVNTTLRIAVTQTVGENELPLSSDIITAIIIMRAFARALRRR